MTNDIIVKPTAELAAENAVNLLGIIARAAADPQVDTAKMQALLDMQMQLQAKQAEIAFSEAMARIQTKMPRISKTGVILNKDGTARSHYAPLDEIDLVVRPLLAEERLSVSYSSSWDSGMMTITCTVKHAMGHERHSTFTVPLDANQYRSGAQNMGSTNSYAKRYAFCNAFNIITIDDNDAQPEPSGPINQEQSDKIEKLLHQTGADRDKFYEYMSGLSGADIWTVKDIPQNMFQKAISALNAKARKEQG